MKLGNETDIMKVIERCENTGVKDQRKQEDYSVHVT